MPLEVPRDTSAYISGLNSGTRYQARVAALGNGVTYDDVWSNWSSISSATTRTCATPTPTATPTHTPTPTPTPDAAPEGDADAHSHADCHTYLYSYSDTGRWAATAPSSVRVHDQRRPDQQHGARGIVITIRHEPALRDRTSHRDRGPGRQRHRSGSLPGLAHTDLERPTATGTRPILLVEVVDLPELAELPRGVWDTPPYITAYSSLGNIEELFVDVVEGGEMSVVNGRSWGHTARVVSQGLFIPDIYAQYEESDADTHTHSISIGGSAGGRRAGRTAQPAIRRCRPSSLD